ncbi:MAG: type II toxin-antitoxin system prevent-host-death family antitoxin [Anaerolineales bacterium]|nr:type II toxin-antitoxin system prevent-host-death family antitoxin [Anaerolineales bacterium]
MPTIGAYQAKTQFSQLIERVTRGERITITRHGVPVAVLSPVAPDSPRPVQDVIADIKAFRQEHRLGGFSVREMIEEGRE